MSMNICTRLLPPRGRMARRAKPLQRFTLLSLALAQILPVALPFALLGTAHAQQVPAETGVAQATAARTLSPALKSRTPVVLNFVNADVEAVTRAMGVMLDRQFVLDPRVKGTITVYSEQPLSVREAFLTYLAALRGLGFTVVENTGLLKVVPESDAKLQAGSVSVGPSTQRGDQVITQIFRLSYENANNMVAVLRPLISPNNTINANPSNNTLVITDYAENLQRLARIIAAMDLPGTSDLEVVPLKHAIASDLAALVQKLADGTGSGASGVPGQASGAISVLADPRSNALILRAPNPAKLAAVRAMIDKLDQPSDGNGGGSIHVVNLKNADATKLAVVLRAAFSANNAGGAGSSAGASSTGLNTAPLTGAAQNNSSSSSSSTSTASSTPVAASAGPSTGGFVQADPSTNSLIITASEPMYRQIRNVIDQLDSRRAQIYVESMIVKVDASRAAAIGVQWQNLVGTKGENVVGLSGTNFGTGLGNIVNLIAAGQSSTSLATALSSNSLPTGFNVGLVGKISGAYSIGMLANLLESQTGANILSTPNLVALDNEEAKIVIGQNVPFVTGSYSSSTSTGGTVNPFQTIDRKDVGLTLRIRSQIGEGGTVRMTIYQENSAVVPSLTSTAGPTTDKSSIETTVVVDDGQIMVLGGLLKDEYSDGDDRVPGLASIPLIGNLFRSENRKRVKTNLMVFLRPVIMRDQQSADQLTLDRYESIRAVQLKNQHEPSLLMPKVDAPVLPEKPALRSSTPEQP